MTESLERPLPHNLDAERSLLGAIILEPDCLPIAAKKVAVEDFFLDQNRRIYDRMMALAESNTVIDDITLTDDLRRRGELDAVGGVPYVASLTDGMPRVTNVEHYAAIVKDKSVLRSVIHRTHAIQQQAFDEDLSGQELLAQATSSLIDLSAELDSPEDEMTYREAAVALIDSFDEQTKKMRAITGIEEVDRIIGGFRGGEVVCVTSCQTGAGKTIFSEGIRRATCARGGHGLYCSGEMMAMHLVGRGLASVSGVKPKRIRMPEKLTEEDKAALREAAMQECPFCTVLHGDLSLAKIRMSAQRLYKVRGRLDVVVVDYDELVDAPGKDDNERMKNLVRGLKRLAMLLDLPVILVSQLRKALTPGEMKKPSLERIHGSGAKSKHSSIVLFIDRPWVRDLKGDKTEAAVYILKNRDGEKGKVDCQFDVQKLKFVDVPKDDQMGFENPPED